MAKTTRKKDNGARSVLVKCPDAMKWLRFEDVLLSKIVPLNFKTKGGKRAHNGVRGKGINNESVNEWKVRIQDGEYNPILFPPPALIELEPSEPEYALGYRYRMGDGHHRREAMSQLGIETMRAEIVKFIDFDGKSADYWQITFMRQRNNPKYSQYYSKENSAEDTQQTITLLITETVKRIPADATFQEIKVYAEEVAFDMDITTKKEKAEILSKLLGSLNTSNPDIQKMIVRSYLPYQIDSMTKKFSKKHKLDTDNALVRKFYVGDAFCSRFDYDQIFALLTNGMIDIEDLKKMFIIGQVTDWEHPDDVALERKRKIKMILKFVEFIRTAAKWLENEKNLAALLAVPFYWVPQVDDDGEDGLPFEVDPTTGFKKVTKRNKRR